MYFVYILKSIYDDKTYVGISSDVKRRLEQHNKGHHLYTKRHKPWKVIYNEKCGNRLIARKKERYFKSAAGRRWMKNNLFS